MTLASPPVAASSAELVRWAFDQINNHDVSALKQFWDDDTLERFPDKTCRGTEEIAAHFEAGFAALPDMRIEIVDLAAQDDDVYVQWHMTGTHSGAPWSGIEPSGRRVELDGIDHFVIRDGRVVSNFVVYDQAQFGRAIGLLPPDGSAPDRAMKAAFNGRTKLLRRLRR